MGCAGSKKEGKLRSKTDHKVEENKDANQSPGKSTGIDTEAHRQHPQNFLLIHHLCPKYKVDFIFSVLSISVQKIR